MKKIKSKVLVLLMCLVVLCMAVSCSSKSSSEESNVVVNSTTAQSETTKESKDSKEETITITDHRGIEVTIPKKIDSVVISSILPLPSVYCLYRGGTTGLVGIPSASMAAAENSYLAKVYPEILSINSDFDKGGEVNIEEIIKLNPDVVFYRANEEAEAELYKKAGIPAVAFSTNVGGVDPVKNLEEWIKLLNNIFDQEEQTKGIVDYGNKVLADIRQKLKDIKPEDKKTAIVFSGFSSGQLTAAGGNIFAQFWIEEAGGINVASELKGSKQVNMEQVYQWNPDIIFINNFCPYVPEDFYNNNIEGYDFSNLNAVKNKMVFKYPLGMYRWYPPASDTPLSLMWMAKCIQPEIFSYIDMNKEMKDYYKEFYGYELTDDDIEQINNPPREAALY